MRALCAAAFLLVAGCTSSLYQQVPRGGAPPAAAAGEYVVRPGDTLYSIATRHRLAPTDVARWNRLANPDRLYVGQRLRLTPPRGQEGREPAARTVAARQPRADRGRAAPSGGASRSQPSRTAPPTAAPPPPWQWPTDGRVVSAFGADGGIPTGIAIGGRAGQPVRAAADGRVVYAGRGLIGYGQLVIIRHNDAYLTAYGYNSELLVTQGQDVRRGATIATMGLGPGREPRLHFEIRRDGVPVDPLLFLPAAR